FQLPVRQDRATKLLTYIAEVIVNGNAEVRGKPKAHSLPVPVPSPLHVTDIGRRQKQRQRQGEDATSVRAKFRELGPEKFVRWVRGEKRLFVTDTTFRDAHQSLLATRMRTYDILRIAPIYAARHSRLFSLEMWGGATFDTSMRFLKESPWDRLADLRERVPNILFQMLLRAANA